MNIRLRSTRLLLLPACALVLVSHHVYREDSFWDMLIGSAGLVLLLTAAGGRIWASAYIAGNKNKSLIVDGPYSMVRNPLYLFSLIGFAGAGLAFESVTLAILFCLIFLLTHAPAIAKEERKLRRRFRERYDRYRREVPAFIPRFSGIRTSETIPLNAVRFSMALRDCMAIPLILVGAGILEWAKLSGLIPVFVYIF